MAYDVVTQAFMRSQYRQLQQFCRQSDLVDVALLRQTVFLIRFLCGAIVQTPAGIGWSNETRLLVRVPERYLLEHPRTNEVLEWDRRSMIWHPNALFSVVCIGQIRRNTPVMDLVFRAHSVLVWRSPNLADPLNPAAAEWARNVLNPEIPVQSLRLADKEGPMVEWIGQCRRERRFVPTDSRPLKWKRFLGGAA